MDSSFHVDKLTNEIFSILENKFLFGYSDDDNLVKDLTKTASPGKGKVRILSIDGRGSTDGILAAKSLTHLEAILKQKHGNPDARVADFFDVAAGSGVGGILASLLFTKGKDGRPLFTAEEALNFLVENRRKIISPSSNGIFRRGSGSEKIFHRTFGETTLKDTLKPILIPCYDLATRAPFLFSRADALEADGYDFAIRGVCVATTTTTTSAIQKPFEMKSVDKGTKIVPVDGGVAMNNPTAAAITHVLNNKQEFPFCNGVEDLLVVSLGNGSGIGTLSKNSLLNIAGEGASDMVDQAVSMPFGDLRTTNYVRIQANGMDGYGKNLVGMVEEMLRQKNIESVLFQGNKVVEKTNMEKLESFAGELIKENERRKTSIFPTVFFKQVSPRTSSATASTVSSSF